MKTSYILFAIATIVPFFMLLGLSAVGAFSSMTVLSIVAMLNLDYASSNRLSYVKAFTKNAEVNPLAA